MLFSRHSLDSMVCDFSLIVCCFGYCRSFASKTLNFINTYMADTRYLAATTRSSNFLFFGPSTASTAATALPSVFQLGHTDAIMKIYLWLISLLQRILLARPCWHIICLINSVAMRLFEFDLKFMKWFFTQKSSLTWLEHNLLRYLEDVYFCLLLSTNYPSGLRFRTFKCCFRTILVELSRKWCLFFVTRLVHLF